MWGPGGNWSLFIFKIAIDLKHLHLILFLISFFYCYSSDFCAVVPQHDQWKKQGGEGTEKVWFPAGWNSSRTMYLSQFVCDYFWLCFPRPSSEKKNSLFNWFVIPLDPWDFWFIFQESNCNLSQLFSILIKK